MIEYPNLKELERGKHINLLARRGLFCFLSLIHSFKPRFHGAIEV